MFARHPDDLADPINVNELLDHIQLYKDQELLYDFKTVTPEILASNVATSMKVDPGIYKGDLNNAVVYYFPIEHENYTDWVYVVMFAYNPPYKVLGIIDVGGHEGDIEFAALRIRKSDNTLMGMYCSAHGDEGGWTAAKDLDYHENGRPIVYIAKNSHAMYPKPGSHYRIFWVANDYTDSIYWDPPLVQISSDNPVWMKYRGSWSRDGIDSIQTRPWFKELPTESATIWYRLLRIPIFTQNTDPQ